MSADFTPTLGEYSGVRPFRFWCQKVLPLVYDDSLSYYEMLCKVKDYLNNVIEDVSAVEGNVTDLLNAYQQLETYVNTYFDSLDISEEIDTKLDTMATDGTLSNLIEPIASDIVSEWLEEHITPTTPSVDSSLSVSGAAADAQTVGNIIYGGRTRSNLIVEPSMAYFTGYDNITSIVDMPTCSFFYASGATLQPLLTNSFTWTLGESVAYSLIKKTYTRTPNYEYWLYRHDLSEIYHGRTLGTNNNSILWSKLGEAELSEIAEAIYGTKDMSNYSTTPLMAEITDLTAIATIDDMPINTFFTTSGSTLQELLPESFTWVLQSPTANYTIRKFPRNANLVEYFIYNGRMSEIYMGRILGSSTSWVKFDIPDISTDFDFVYSDLEVIDGWWNSSGEIETPTPGTSVIPAHTQMLPIRPNSIIYLAACGLSASGQASTTVKCAYFDKHGNFLSVGYASNLISTNYKKPDGYGTQTGYSNTYYTTTPVGAYYISMNINKVASWLHRQYIASKPVFCRLGSGNYIWPKMSPLAASTSTRKLCVIGASSVMIDRLNRPGLGEYVSGFQEYLIPWFNLVESYGYNGTPWCNTSGYSSSIYNEVVTKQLDISKYDTFLLCYSLNGTTNSNLGTYTDNGGTTAIGAINATIDYIYSVVPNAKIYVTNLFQDATPVSGAIRTNYNEQIELLCNYRGCKLVDLKTDSGINQSTINSLTYDGAHPNQLGMRQIGECMRRTIVGF